MLKFRKNSYKRESDVFKALGHPIRLWIVKQLAGGEHCVCEFVEPSGVRFATISQHLTILKQAGVIKDEKRGKSVFYSLRCPCVTDMLDCIGKRK